jgi:hypothetical protein
MSTDNILAPIAALTLPDAAAVSNRAQQALAFIEGFAVDSAETYGLAADELKAIKRRATDLETQRSGITGPINHALRAINALFAGPAGYLERAERLLKGKMLGYQAEQERLAAEERRKAEEAAAAERRRIAEEAAARQREADAQAKAAAEAAAAGDAARAAAAQAEADRASAEAQSVAATAELVTAPVVAMARPTAAGVSTRTQVDFEVVDLQLLVRHVANHPDLLGLLKADETRVRAYVRGLGTACALPGVRVFQSKVLSSRAA